MQLRIPLADLRLLLPFRSFYDDVRPQLAGIAVQPVKSGGCMLVATNGAVLAAYHSHHSQCRQNCTLALADGFDDNARLVGRGVKAIVTVAAERRLTICAPDGRELYVKPGQPFIEEESYPDWRQAVPDQEDLVPGAAGVFDTSCLAVFREVLKSAGHGYPDHVLRAYVHRDVDRRASSPTVFLLDAIPGLVMLIMPMTHDEPAQFPAWMKSQRPS